MRPSFLRWRSIPGPPGGRGGGGVKALGFGDSFKGIYKGSIRDLHKSLGFTGLGLGALGFRVWGFGG